jgi:hypothetical protein
VSEICETGEQGVSTVGSELLVCLHRLNAYLGFS